MNHDHEQHQQGQPAIQKASPRNWIFWGFLAIAVFFLFSEHRAHALGVLPYLLLLACPLMHIFMHRGHGHGDGKGAGRDQGGHRHD